MEIKKLQKAEIKEALGLVWEVFLEFEAPEYASEGIEEFKAFIEYDSVLERMSLGILNFWGCYSKDELVGVLATKFTGHICLLFVKKQYHRQGIARHLFETLRSLYYPMNVKEITVNSSPYAVEFYRRLGFKETDSEQVLNGIRFTPMSYHIDR